MAERTWKTPEPPIEPPEPVTVCECCMCRQEIYEGEWKYTDVLDNVYCSEDCLKEAIKDEIDEMSFTELENIFSVSKGVAE